MTDTPNTPLVGYELAAQIDVTIDLVKGSENIADGDKRKRLTQLRRQRLAAIKVGDALKAEADKFAPIWVAHGKEMININVEGVEVKDLFAKIEEIVRKEHGYWIVLAAKMNADMPFDWFDISNKEDSDNKRLLYRDYRDPLTVALTSAKHSNPPAAWKRLCDYGRNMRNKRSPDGKRMLDGTLIAGEGQSTGGAKGNEARTPLVRNGDELSALYAANVRFKSTDDRIIKCQEYIVLALAAVGIDARLIKVDKSK